MNFRRVQGRGDDVGGEVRVEDLSLVEDELFHQGIARAHHAAAFHLSIGTTKVDDLAHILGSNQFLNLHFPGFNIHQDLSSLGAEGRRTNCIIFVISNYFFGEIHHIKPIGIHGAIGNSGLGSQFRNGN